MEIIKLPSIEILSDVLDYSVQVLGFNQLSNSYSSYRVEKSENLHEVGGLGEWKILSVNELVKERVNIILELLNQINLNFDQFDKLEITQFLNQKSNEINKLIYPIWSQRFNTRTAMIRKKNEILFTDIDNELFRNNNLVDYSKIIDGGAKFNTKDIPGEVYSIIKYSEYLKSFGGNRSLMELSEHKVLEGLIPDKELRNDYLVSLGLLDITSNYERGTQSIWLPSGLDENGGFRWYSLGKKADAFYPPNMTTKYMELIMKKI